ncbi:MAG: hypothetical protein ACOX4I_04330 [Anaerovoracaceae bacterium]|jgi:hypothetical protein
MAVIISYSKGKREYLEKLYKDKILGLNSTIDNKDQALFFAALGIDNPTKLPSRDSSGWFRLESIKTSADKALMSCPLLGTASNDKEVDEYTDLDACMDYIEKCAENGFSVLEEKIEKADGDNDLIERRMLKNLDFLYTNNVENDI